jgi:hypothetical protein
MTPRQEAMRDAIADKSESKSRSSIGVANNADATSINQRLFLDSFATHSFIFTVVRTGP